MDVSGGRAADLDLATVRAFVAVADEGQFGLAAGLLGISQQAVSKRIARLENLLGVALFDRVPAGATPTAAARRFLAHARALLALADEAVATATARPGPLRVAILGERLAEMRAMRFYLDRHPEAEVEFVQSNAYVTSRDALLGGRADVAFARASGGPRPLPAHIAAVPAYLDVLHLLVGKDNPLAARSTVTLAELVEHPVWVPGAAVPSEWADYYDCLSRFSGVTVDRTPRGQLFPDADTSRGLAPIEALLEHIAASKTLSTFNGDGFDLPWHPHIRRVRVVDPTPAYPHALLWNSVDPHPGLAPLIAHFRDCYNSDATADCWVPDSDRALFLS
ncbi:LysR family transcriptional regulator [Nocardia carnea]|uniref:LysR family transcriptional regulator n=1 Tax=Nocardia carnea TaxID=37328 RepID=UPI002458F9E4|nr:LysR family transcriptional regulator [Nocardia carnea]